MADQRKDRGSPNRPPESRSWPWIVLFLLGFMVVLHLMSPGPEEARRRYEIPYTQLKALVEQGKVAEVRLRGHELEGKAREPMPLGPRGERADRFLTRVPAFGEEALLPALERHGVEVRVAENGRDGLWPGIFGWLPSLLFVVLLFWLMRRSALREVRRASPGGA